MKKIIITLIFAAFSVILLSAMPPHPRVIQENIDNDTLPQLSRQLAKDIQIGKNQADKSFPSNGTRQVLVLVTAFKDASLDVSSTASFYDLLFTGVDENALSWTKYYKDMSNNNLILEFDVFRVLNGSPDSLELKAYYGGNDAGGNDQNPGQLVAEAVADGASKGVIYSDYDNDNNGELDVVIIIHQGQGEEYSGTATDIWSHRWNLDSADYYNNGSTGWSSYATDTGNDGILDYDGVLINDYAIQPEYNDIAGDSTIGVFVHEFGHVLGLPDLYDTGSTSDGIGLWGVMSGGSWLGQFNKGSQPAPLTAWSRARLGWLTVDTVNAKVIHPFVGIINKILLFVLISLILLILIVIIRGNLRFKGLILLPIFLISLISISTCSKDGNNTPTLITIDLADIETSYRAEKININSNEYLLVENKTIIDGSWTQYLPGQGLTVYHIDNNLIAGRYSTNTINDYSINGQLGIKLVEADANNGLLTIDGDYGSATDPFYFGNINSITNYIANSGETASFEISNITGVGSVISFDVLSY